MASPSALAASPPDAGEEAEAETTEAMSMGLLKGFCTVAMRFSPFRFVVLLP